MMSEGLTPSQTVGPFFAVCLTPTPGGFHQVLSSDLAAEGSTGERLRLEGTVLDGAGQPVSDAIVEIWQADAQGRYAGADAAGSNAPFRGFGRCGCDAEGRFAFTTVKPGPVPGPRGELQAPHISIGVLARGLLKRLHTRVYFEDEAANGRDPVLRLVPEARRTTLLARRTGEGTYSFTIRLQGEQETVFFLA